MHFRAVTRLCPATVVELARRRRKGAEAGRDMALKAQKDTAGSLGGSGLKGAETEPPLANRFLKPISDKLPS